MMMTDEWLAIIEQTDELADMILSSDVLVEYRSAHQAVYGDPDLVKKIRNFSDMKDRYEEVQRFGRYHPDYSIVMKSIRLDKRALDMNEKVAALRLAENDVQYMLDEISAGIAHSVSESVKLPTDNTFVTDSSCGGSCGTGGGCSCSA
ncbi:YlbF family regulator [Sporosarcina jeotgali]|uniref:YlbF family regulator n=1 Tax=Sporosarcina jeotgali TaxID=3020056 RepID=A0ABZ0KYY5_9BACL|nr:YlbF family regulator [Sporosarcina sp. B2O-1]WOV85175.1 YlbF family regulator [Sporosarcina sp. B2O-1]